MSVLSDFLPAGGAGGGSLVYKQELFTSSGTWTRPAAIWQNQVWVTAIGGGSSGNSSTVSNGGNGGHYVTREPVDVSGASSVTVTVGAGGSAVNGGGSDTVGNAGGSSSFGAFISVDGGVSPAATGVMVENKNGSQGAIDATGAAFFYSSTSGTFGVVGVPQLASGNHGGPGLAIGNSVPTPTALGGGVQSGYGYGAGGHASNGSNTNSSAAGTDGAVLVEWYEEA